MKRIISLLLTLALLLSAGAALAADEWYCPECGRKNTDNFCPNDGTKRPDDAGTGTATTAASDLKVDSVKMETDGSITVSWSGGTGPYNVYYQYYVNGSHNSGADVTSWTASSGIYDTRQNYQYDFVPGEHYWVIVTDANNNEAWYDYEEYVGAFSRANCPYHFSLRTFRKNRASMVKYFSARDVESEFSYHLFGANIKINPNLKQDMSAVCRMGIKLPSGEPVLIHVENVSMGPHRGWYIWQEYNFKTLWNILMQSKKTIPTGTYQFKLFFDDEYVFTEEFVIDK